MKINFKNAKIQYLLVLGSNALILILGFLTNIIVTHTMQTEDYGFYKAVVNSMTTMTSLFSLGFSLTFSRVFAQSPDESKKRKIVGYAIIINLIISAAIFIVCLLLCGAFSLFSLEFPSYIVWASAFAWVLLLERFYLQKFQGENRMVAYSSISVFPKIFIGFAFLIAWLLKLQISAFIATLFYLLSAIILIVFFIIKEPPILVLEKELTCEILDSNKAYGFQLYLGSLASVACAEILNLSVASISNLEEYALFTLGLSFASPIKQIPAVMGTISFKNNVSSNKMPTKQILVTILMTILSLVAYVLFLNYILILLIGESYLGGMFYASIMVFYYALLGLGDYFNRFIIAKGEGKSVRNSSIIVGVVLVVSAIILIPFFNVTGLIIAETLSGAVYLFNMVFLYIRLVRKIAKNEAESSS